MQSMIKQTRLKFANVDEEKMEEINRERRLQPQKIRPFKEKRTQNWLHRQFSRQMSRDYDFSDMEHATAVAAAINAITLLESENPDQKKTNLTPETSSSLTNKAKKDVTISVTEPGRVSLSGILSGEGSKGNMERANSKMPINNVTDVKNPEKVIGIVSPPLKKTTSSANKQLSRTGSTKKERAVPKPPLPFTGKTQNVAPTIEPRSDPKLPAAVPRATIPQSSVRPGVGNTEADAWEKSEMTRIKERYEKLNSTINSWAEKKKKKARRKLDGTESELERRRARALQHYRSELVRIDEIASGAKVKAEDRRRNKELNAKEKAKKIRSTGKVPASCLCF